VNYRAPSYCARQGDTMIPTFLSRLPVYDYTVAKNVEGRGRRLVLARPERFRRQVAREGRGSVRGEEGLAVAQQYQPWLHHQQPR